MLRNLFTVFRGTVTAQLVGLAVLPILTRLFAPEAFGNYQVYQSILNALVIVASLRLETLILRAKADDVTPILRSALVVALIFSAAAALGALLAKLLGDVPSLSELPLPLVALGLFLSGIIQAYSYVLMREHDFHAFVRIKIVRATAYALVAITIGLVSRSLAGLIVADIAGRLASVVVVYVHARQGGRSLVARTSLRAALSFAWSHRHGPVIIAPGAFLNAAGAAITPVMMYAHFNPGVSGQFAVVQSAVGLPVAMVVVSVSQVYAAQLSQHLRDHDLRAISYANRVTVGAALLALLALFLIPVLPSLFVWVLGEGWRVAGRFAQFLAPAYGIALVYGALNQSLIAMGHYKVQLAWDSLWPVSFGLVWLVVLVFRLSPEWAVALHALAVCVLGVTFLTLVHVLLRRCDFQAPIESRLAMPANEGR